jgi:excisionase family DNA binding protein
MKTNETPILHDASSVSRRLGVSEASVMRLARQRIIPSVRLGYRLVRFDLSEVETALMKLRRPARGERLAGGAS